MLTPTYFTNIAEHFYNVIKKSKEFMSDSLVTDTSLLEPLFGEKIEKLSEIIQEKGGRIKRMETFRSAVNQIKAFQSHHSSIKTNGMHYYGIAQDILCLDSNGKIIEKGEAKEYTLLRNEAVNLGLYVIGTWDAGHIQGIPVSLQNAMREYVLNYKSGKYPMLAYGIENHYVMNLKIALAKLGYRVNQDDMFFGEQTDESLRKFQLDNKLKVDGVAGEQVYTKMEALGYNLLTM
ncbi:MAG: peptidoglycan-binding protein [Bacteroidetes bacterium]|nr:peptidoglycan-binding protein [Bacteroidota bacterium]